MKPSEVYPCAECGRFTSEKSGGYLEREIPYEYGSGILTTAYCRDHNPYRAIALAEQEESG